MIEYLRKLTRQNHFYNIRKYSSCQTRYISDVNKLHCNTQNQNLDDSYHGYTSIKKYIFYITLITFNIQTFFIINFFFLSGVIPV